MRVLATLGIALLVTLWCGIAYATVTTHTRHVEWAVYEPCDVLVAEGETALEWDDWGGDLELVTIEYEDYPHPLTLLFYVGCPDWGELSEHAYYAFFCGCCTKCKPDVYCMDCDPCAWYCYETKVCWCGEWVYAKASLPTCMKLEILDVW